MAEVKVKPFWQSVSFWMTIATIISIAFDKLIAGGIIPNEGWFAIVASVVGLVAKRGLTENVVIKANALTSAAADPTKPPQV